MAFPPIYSPPLPRPPRRLPPPPPATKCVGLCGVAIVIYTIVVVVVVVAIVAASAGGKAEVKQEGEPGAPVKEGGWGWRRGAAQRPPAARVDHRRPGAVAGDRPRLQRVLRGARHGVLSGGVLQGLPGPEASGGFHRIVGRQVGPRSLAVWRACICSQCQSSDGCMFVYLGLHTSSWLCVLPLAPTRVVCRSRRSEGAPRLRGLRSVCSPPFDGTHALTL